MNTQVTSKKDILDNSRLIVAEHGIEAINMRDVANACGIAVGSLYNYFPSKNELVSHVVTDVWRDIFHISEKSFEFKSLIECVDWMFESIERGSIKYPGFFDSHSAGFMSDESFSKSGVETMNTYFYHIKSNMIKTLKQDKSVRKDAFNDKMSEYDFIDMLFELIMSLFLSKQYDNHTRGVVLEIINRCIY